jgi:hypothetical protein
MEILTDLADELTDAVAIVALVIVAVNTSADATTVVAAIAGLAGYKMRGRR